MNCHRLCEFMLQFSAACSHCHASPYRWSQPDDELHLVFSRHSTGSSVQSRKSLSSYSQSPSQSLLNCKQAAVTAADCSSQLTSQSLWWSSEDLLRSSGPAHSLSLASNLWGLFHFTVTDAAVLLGHSKICTNRLKTLPLIHVSLHFYHSGLQSIPQT